ncbi:acetolactate synthase large subunit [Candidatus Heimdallarchaeota archaeon B3_Heim]|nr:MAG: acetolactate synthase large subunit [Candidatus Heimdallarchaeota archaeon B3_Heim]
MKASDLLVKALENEGVKYIFGVPGEENLDFLESLRTSSISLILTRHEQAAGFMAATYGRLTGKTGVCLSTLGPGATNFVTAAAYAQLGAMPMLMLTGQKPIKQSKQGQFQIVDIVHMMQPLTKYTKQIVNGNTIPAIVREAFRIAEEERPGAVHIELPEDIAREDTSCRIFPVSQVRRPTAEIKAIQTAVRMLEQAKRPLIVIGAGANRKRTQNMLREFVDKTGIPFINTQMGKGVIDERHPQYLGTTALSFQDYIHCAINHADLILNVGHDVVEKPPFIMDERNPVQVIHINFLSAAVDEVYFPQLEVIGDIANSIWQIKEQIIPQDWDFEYFLQVKSHLETHIAEGESLENFPLYPQKIVGEVRDAMPSDGIICLDNGVYKIWFARNYKAHNPNSVLLDNALATMGAGLPSAIGAKLVHPTKRIMAILGDGGFMMNSQELETAVRMKLDLVILILNDSAYGMIKWKQSAMGFTNFGLGFSNPDFCKYAESYGATGYKLQPEDDLHVVLKQKLNTPGVHLIDVPVDYSDNERVLIQELGERLCLLE